MNEMEELLTRVSARARELEEQGLDSSHAFGRAWLEDNIAERWPSGWGNDFQALIYGDFKPPKEDINVDTLRIVVHRERVTESIIRPATCVLKATVAINERSIEAVLDAVRRLNLLLGAWTITNWANSACGWWSHITHGSMSTIAPSFQNDELVGVAGKLLDLRPDIQQKVEAALYWIRSPHRLLMTGYDIHIFRTYSNHWNAFECLVEAVNVAQPRHEISRNEKRAYINRFIQERVGSLTSGDIDELYRSIVNPGFVGRAKHALDACFGERAQRYRFECFDRPDEENRLYNIRNAINHGSISAENPDERMRIESRHSVLTLMLLQMFAQFVPYAAPSINSIDHLQPK